MNKHKSLSVFMNQQKVGTLAVARNHTIAFEYEDEWIKNGFSISPFSLPLQKQVFLPKFDPFDGLFGVFSDSLPDSWGRLLVDRLLLREGIDPLSVDSLNRLAIVGESGMGALTYQPACEMPAFSAALDYDRLATACMALIKTENSGDLDELFILGGSSGGARPKILTTIDGEEWIIKFPSATDREDIGLSEYRYSQCARACGIEMAETKLFPSKLCAGYFGTKRFDRKKNANGETERIHMLSVSAILEVSHRIPNLDYRQLMKLTLILTKNFEELEKLYRLMCFNVYAHNRDDHSRNFTLIYDSAKNSWSLSPAYDLTYSNSLGGEHATCVNGNGRNPGLSDILAVANQFKFSKEHAKSIAREIEEIVKSMLHV